jgi:hypothetical protein
MGRRFFYLKKFSEREGHCRVAQRYKTDDGYRLGHWVARQRSAKKTVNPDRRQRLEALPGWSWNVLSDWWEEGFSYLRTFSEREAHCRMAQGCKTDGYVRVSVAFLEQPDNAAHAIKTAGSPGQTARTRSRNRMTRATKSDFRRDRSFFNLPSPTRQCL